MRKILSYGLTNIDLAQQLHKSTREILTDVKDNEHSFELKIAIYQSLILYKERHEEHDKILNTFAGLLRSIYEYIIKIDVKYGP